MKYLAENIVVFGKKELFTPGFICVLHTLGRDLKWNPHIHCLISEGGLGESSLWRRKDQHHKNGFYVYAKQENVTRWRSLIASSFGYDPLKCPVYGAVMHLPDLYYKHERISYYIKKAPE